MTLQNKRRLWTGVAFAAVTIALGSAFAQQGPRGVSSYAPVTIVEPSRRSLSDCRRRNRQLSRSTSRSSGADGADGGCFLGARMIWHKAQLELTPQS